MYTGVYAELLAYYNQAKMVIPIVVIASQMIMLFIGIANVNGVMFGFKDYDMLMSLPIKPSQIVISKIIYSYIADLFLSIMIMVPTLINVANFVSLAFSEYVLYLLGTLLLPLLPLGIAFIVGTFFSVITSRFKYKNIVQTVSMVLFMIVIFIISFMSGYMEENAEIISTLTSISYFMSDWFLKGLTNPIYMLIFALVSIFAFLVPAVVIGANFKKINTMLLTKKSGKKFILRSDKERGQLKALVFREFKRLINCPIYVLNCVVGGIMTLLISIVFAILLGSETGIQEISEIVAVVMSFIVGAFASMTPTTSSSISIDGKDYWIYKTCPIKTERILNAKLILNLLVNIPLTAISILIIGISLKVNVIGIILSLIFSALLVYLSSILGLIMNLRFPMLKWENEYVPLKRGMSIFLSMIIYIVFVALLGVLAYLLFEFGWYFSLIVPIVLTILASAIVTYLTLTKGVELYNNSWVDECDDEKHGIKRNINQKK